VRQPSPEKLREIRILLKAAYDAVLSEPIPESIHDKLREIK